jgi:hypothetical protein
MSGNNSRLDTFVDSFAPSSEATARRHALSKTCLEKTTQGATRDDVLSFLREQGASPTDALVILMELYGLPLKEAKRVFSAHPAWHEVTEASDKLHQELIDALDSESAARA